MDGKQLHHLFEQAKAGEFAILSDEAKGMTHTAFAAKYGAKIEGNAQFRVTVDGCDYFWDADTGKFDGWGRGMV